MSDEIPEYMTVAEVAVVFRKSQQTIYRKIRNGVFEGVTKVDDGYLIPKTSVLQVLEDGESAVGEEVDAPPGQARRRMISKGISG